VLFCFQPLIIILVYQQDGASKSELTFTPHLIFNDSMQKKTIKDLDLTNRAIIMRVDYNVPLSDESGKQTIVDDTRIKQSLPTIRHILSQNPKRLILMSHLGEPENGPEPKFSLKPIADHLTKLLSKPVLFVDDYRNEVVQKHLQSLTHGEVVLLENVRFYKEETLNNRRFSADLAQLGDLFVNDAFGSSHRAHASVVGVAEFLPAVAGLLLEKEIEIIGNALDKPEPPFVVILGGAKATTKIPMIERLMTKADFMLLGGGVANTFLKAFSYHVGRSVYSKESIRLAQNLIWKATRVNTRLFMPSDVVIGSFASKTKVGVVSVESIPVQFQALDIGPVTIKDFIDIITKAKTIIWNGPVGANEIPVFQHGTKAIYDAIAANKQAVSIVGGGDTLSSIKGFDHLGNITHISTGGGAMLEFIEKGTLPGIEVLQDK
jgi:phosphoglycerate kinase